MIVNISANSTGRDLLSVLDDIVKESPVGEDTRSPLLKVRPALSVAPKSESNVPLFPMALVPTAKDEDAPDNSEDAGLNGRSGARYDGAASDGAGENQCVQPDLDLALEIFSEPFL